MLFHLQNGDIRQAGVMPRWTEDTMLTSMSPSQMSVQTSAASSQRLTGLGYGLDRFIIGLIDPTSSRASLDCWITCSVLVRHLEKEPDHRSASSRKMAIEQSCWSTYLKEVMSFHFLGGSNPFASTFERHS